jgi:uncharacterized protein RhaS with RHS repeats
MNRFLSPDAPFADQSEGDPQSWNLYTYVRNNPMSFIDPLGLARTNVNGEWVGDKDGEFDPQTGLYWHTQTNSWGDKNNTDFNVVTEAGPVTPPSSWEDYAFIGKAKWIARNIDDNETVPDETQSPLSRLLFGQRRIPYQETVTTDYASYWAMQATLNPSIGAHKYSGKTVEEILKLKRGSIKDAQLEPGSPSWSDVLSKSWEQIESSAKAGKAGYKTIKKLLTDTRFDK